MASGRVTADLENFTIRRDGKRFRSSNFNFWGVTFAKDGDRFFATLSSGKDRYLIEESARGREAGVLVTGVECPSLSPDNTRIAFKRSVLTESGGYWSRLPLISLTAL